ncbi:hypothetical protein BDQ17DRAFT_1401227 [Cyathus striatus]|nr:hypothetical protein BDQ17DRAFT_1401227 [Cyathus striatus]
MQRVWSTYLGPRRSESPGPNGHSNGTGGVQLTADSRRSSLATLSYYSHTSTQPILLQRHAPARLVLLLTRNTTGTPASYTYTQPPSATQSSSYLSPPHPSFLPARTQSDVSLSINYLPHKFSSTLLSPSSLRKRKGTKGDGEPLLLLPKRGGGVEAFKSGEARMPDKQLQWNRFKWALFVTNLILSIYSLTTLILTLLTWKPPRTHSFHSRRSLGVFTSLIGWAGILLNNRSFLAVYTFLLWLVLALITTPGYITTARGLVPRLGTLGRLRIQNELSCCGYYSPFVEATVSQTCYARSILPGCKAAYWNFERKILERFYTIAFISYRLNVGSMAVIMDNYASQLAEQYGTAIAAEVIQRSRANSNVDVDAVPAVSSGLATPQY